MILWNGHKKDKIYHCAVPTPAHEATMSYKKYEKHVFLSIGHCYFSDSI